MIDCETLGGLRTLTADMPDDTPILVAVRAGVDEFYPEEYVEPGSMVDLTSFHKPALILTIQQPPWDV